MSIQITTLSENTAARVNLLANPIIPAHTQQSPGAAPCHPEPLPIVIASTCLFVIVSEA